jgi:S1-C subfamily serine protease
MVRLFLQVSSILGLAALVFFTPQGPSDPPRGTHSPVTTEVAIATTTASTASTSPEKKKVNIVTDPEIEATTPPEPDPESHTNASDGMVKRTQNPYPYAPRSSEALDSISRTALVNIYCVASGRSIGSISGSGVLIDSRGVILTNAHVAQFLLLETSSKVDISCSIRTGSPARARYTAKILYLPEAWITEHAKDIMVEKSKGNGENDFALLLITESTDGSPLPTSFPHLPTDTREAIAFTDDSAFLAAYPAEFGGPGINGDLYVSSVFTKIGDLYTFNDGTVDLISLGGIVLAQGGSSGGAAVNVWGHVVGIISTTSEGETTGERDLRAITLSYVNRALKAQTNSGLSAFLTGDLQIKAADFMKNTAPSLAEHIISEIEKH